MIEVLISIMIDVEVCYVEIDQMGVVYYLCYFVWFEFVCIQLCCEVGYFYDEIEKQGFWFMVSGVYFFYCDGVCYGDIVQVECCVLCVVL